MTSKTVTTSSALENCLVCGSSIDTHPRCKACRICVGEGHVEKRLIDGRCSACAELWRKREMHV
jgi:hypothetical protein